MIVGYSRGAAVAPATNLTLQFDPSNAGHVWKTLTSGNNPCWSDAAADGDAVQASQSIIPAPTSETVLGYWSTTNQSPLFKSVSPALPRADLLFDGSNDALAVFNRTGTTAQQWGSYMAVGAKTILVAFRFTSCTVNSGNPWLNSIVVADGSQFWGIHIRRSSTGPDVHKLQFYNWDGNSDVTEITVTTNTNYVACLRHDGTNIYGSINGGSESSVASGNTTSTIGRIAVGGSATASNALAGSIGEILIYNAALSGSNLTNAIAYMGRWL
jgi:hypothetical protein